MTRTSATRLPGTAFACQAAARPTTPALPPHISSWPACRSASAATRRWSRHRRWSGTTYRRVSAAPTAASWHRSRRAARPRDTCDVIPQRRIATLRWSYSCTAPVRPIWTKASPARTAPSGHESRRGRGGPASRARRPHPAGRGQRSVARRTSRPGDPSGRSLPSAFRSRRCHHSGRPAARPAGRRWHAGQRMDRHARHRCRRRHSSTRCWHRRVRSRAGVAVAACRTHRPPPRA